MPARNTGKRWTWEPWRLVCECGRCRSCKVRQYSKAHYHRKLSALARSRTTPEQHGHNKEENL